MTESLHRQAELKGMCLGAVGAGLVLQAASYFSAKPHLPHEINVANMIFIGFVICTEFINLFCSYVKGRSMSLYLA